MANSTVSSTDQVISENDHNGDGINQNDVQVSLFNSLGQPVNGTAANSVFGFLDGLFLPVGVRDELVVWGQLGGLTNGNSLTADTIVLENINDPNAPDRRFPGLLWDNWTQTSYNIGPQDIDWWKINQTDPLNGPRHGMTYADRTAAYEIVRGGVDDNYVKLDFNAANPGSGLNNGFAYTWDITIEGNIGHDTFVGGNGNDLIFGGDEGSGGDYVNGGGGNDTVYGGMGIDTLVGGDGDDNLGFGLTTAFNLPNGDVVPVSGFDATLLSNQGNGADYVLAWDGASGSNRQVLLAAGNYNTSFDFFFGGAGSDTIVMTGSNDVLTLNNDDIFVNNQNNTPGGANRLSSIEVVLAGAGADIIAMNDANQNVPASGTLYTTNITIAGQDGADTVFSGSGADLIVGGNMSAVGANTEADLLFGGAGGDTLWGDNFNDPNGATGGGDTLYGGGGLDTYYGGGGDDTISDGAIGTDVDVMYGGAGNDALTDSANANAFGGDGADQITLTHSIQLGNFTFSGGADAAGDGNDRVIVTGSYNLSSGSLGAGNDIYISNAVGTGLLGDSVDGQSGNDAIATYAGDDTLSGGDGEDVLWGGAGNDQMFGGNGTDFLYPQGGNDTMFGGAGFDFVYFGRNDGADVYNDQNDVIGSGARENWIVVYGAFNQAEVGATADFLLNGAGVRETDHNLTDAINNGTGDMASITNLSGTNWQLNVRDTNVGNGQSTLQFDSRDVAGIGLWDNDHLDGHVLQVYLWNGTTYAYSYSI